MGDVRYVAEWCIEIGNKNGEVEPHLCKYAKQAFPATPGFDDPTDHDPAMTAAAKHGCERNCYGSECFIDVEEYGYDEGLFSDTGRKSFSWWYVERYLCGDGVVIERVD